MWATNLFWRSRQKSGWHWHDFFYCCWSASAWFWYLMAKLDGAPDVVLNHGECWRNNFTSLRILFHPNLSVHWHQDVSGRLRWACAEQTGKGEIAWSRIFSSPWVNISTTTNPSRVFKQTPKVVNKQKQVNARLFGVGIRNTKKKAHLIWKKHTLPKTNSSSPLKIGRAPKGNCLVWTKHPFSGANSLASFQGGEFYPKWCNSWNSNGTILHGKNFPPQRFFKRKNGSWSHSPSLFGLQNSFVFLEVEVEVGA